MTTTSSSLSTSTFPHPELTAITDKPTIATVKLLRRKIFANARAIPSTAGGGNNGHLGLIMANAAYVARAGVPFVEPVHPGPLPIHPPGATSAQITATNRQYDTNLAAQTLCVQVKEELRKQILAAVPKIYLPPEDPNFGYADITPMAMMTHLNDTYGTMTQDEIEANRAKLDEPYNVDEGIESLWTRIADVQALAAAAGEPILDNAAIRLTLHVLEETGLFTQGCRDWHKKPVADQTMVNFRSHFNDEDNERRRLLTAQQAGYHGANQATETPNVDEPPTETLHQANAAQQVN